MGLLRKFGVNVISNWVALAVRVVTQVALVPYLIVRLGEGPYGVWALIGSFLAYVALLDLGLTVAIRRYTARYVALKNQADQNAMMSTAVGIYLVVALVGALVTFVAAPFVPVVMKKIPEELHADTIALFRLGAAVAFLRLFLLPFKGFLQGMFRYEISNAAFTLGRLVYCGLVVLLLEIMEPRVPVVALAVILSMLFEVLFMFVASIRVAPALRISPRLVSREQLRHLADFGMKSFVLAVCGLLIFQAPNFIITGYLGPDLTAVFAVAMMLGVMLREAIGGMGSVFIPVFSASHAREDLPAIEDRLWKGSQACNLLNWTMITGVLVFADPILTQWLAEKPDVAQAAYWPLIILIIGQLSAGVDHVGNSALAGCGYLGGLVVAMVTAAIISLTFGILSVSVLGWGIEGVALGVAAPMLIRGGLWLPWYACRRLGLRLWPFVRRAYLRPLAACAALAAICLVVRRFHTIQSRVSLLATAAVLGVVAIVVGFRLGLSPDVRERLLLAVRRRRGAENVESS